MNFNNPIPRAIQPLFQEGSALRSVFDSDNNSQAWKKMDAGNSQLQSLISNVQTLQRRINLLQRRQPGYIIPATGDYYPFKVYQPTQESLQTPQGQTYTATTFDQTGTPIMVVIDSNNPTNEAANPPTYNPNTDYWRFWFVRDGVCEVRPYYSLAIDYQNGNQIIGPTFNNFSYQQDVYYGSDLLAGEYDSTNVGTPSAGFFEAGVNYPDTNVYGGCLIISGALDETSDPEVCFFIEITPDTSGELLLLTRIKVRRFSTVTGSPYFGLPLPAYSPFIIPIGIIAINTNGGNQNQVEQFMFNHAIFRWQTAMTPMSQAGVLAPPSQANLYTTNVVGPRQYRGNWQTDEVIQTQVFYPGDEVTFTQNGLVTVQDSETMAPCFGQSTIIETYLCINNCLITSGDPSTDNNFVLVGSAISAIIVP